MKGYRFTLVLAGVAEITPELADALYEATDGDIEFTMCDGVAVLEFERTGSSVRDAIMTAIDQVDHSSAGVRVVRVESDEANTIARINVDLFGIASPA